MLYFNVKRIMRLRGIENHYTLLQKLGFNPWTTNNILRREARQIKLDQIEAMCVALNCTPNDLFEWQPSSNSTLSANHALNDLKARPDGDVVTLFNQMPIGKFEQILDILQDSTKGD